MSNGRCARGARWSTRATTTATSGRPSIDTLPSLASWVRDEKRRSAARMRGVELAGGLS
jgi:hypothetical protein